MTDHHADIDKRVRGYIIIGATLLLLTVITVAVAYVDFGVRGGIVVALIIASIKGSLVAGYFMHLISEKKLIYTVLVITVAFFVVLLFVPVLTILDGFGS